MQGLLCTQAHHSITATAIGKFWYDDEFWRKVINPNRIRVAALAGGSGGKVDESPEEFAERCANDRLTQKIITRRTKYAHCFTVRDPHSHALLNRLGIENRLLPCTATFAGMYYNVPYAPQKGRVAIVPSSPNFIAGESPEDVMDRFASVVQKFRGAGYNPIAVFHGQKEFDRLRSKLNPSELFFSNDFYSLLKFYGSCEGIVSARLHGTLPAWGIGAERAVNISIDSRGCAADVLGIANLKYKEATPEALLASYESIGEISSDDRNKQIEYAVQEYASVLTPAFKESGWIV